MCLHWGMAMAVYPFFTQVAETIGRLLRLQDTLNLSQIQRRMKERFGERSTTSRATQRIVRSLVDWGVLQDIGKRGNYEARKPITVSDKSLALWLLEASLYSTSKDTGDLSTLQTMPALFSLESIPLNPGELEDSRLEVVRHGLDRELVRLRDSG